MQILLVTAQGAVLEGTQTNVFAVKDNKLYTAQEGVLLGTVRGVVLQVSCLPKPLHFVLFAVISKRHSKCAVSVPAACQR